MRMPRPLRDLVLLSVLCVIGYFVGLTTHGLTNWQEGQRALVAREMQERGDWLVPTAEGRAYLAKPPLIYWCQLGLAEAMGRRVGEFELRLTVALAGWLGVVVTYLAGLRMLRGPDAEEGDGVGGASGLAGRGALFAGLFLATGLLPTRSARIGELDVLLIPTTVCAVWALHEAWRLHVARRDCYRRFGLVALAALATTLAALAKGPPALLVVFLAAYGGVALRAGFDAPLKRRPIAGLLLGAVGLPVLAMWVNGFRVSGGDVPGLVAFGAMGAVLGGILERAARRGPLAEIGWAWLHLGLPVVMGVPVLALWAWSRMVAERIGREKVLATAAAEAEDNLRVFVMESPLNNLEAMSFGVGVGSVAAIGATVWLLVARPRWGLGWWMVAAWVGLGLIAFSTLGKGVGRYLTPVWPGVALLGGLWVARCHLDPRIGRRAGSWIRGVAIGACVVLAVGQGWWYGWGREMRNAERSPRALVSELLGERGYGSGRLALFEVSSPATHFYAGRTLRKFARDPGMQRYPGFEPVSDLEEYVRGADGDVVLLAPETLVEGLREWAAEAGLVLEVIEAEASFALNSGKSPIVALEVGVAAEGRAP